MTRAVDTNARPDTAVQRSVERDVEQVLDEVSSPKPREHADCLTCVAAALLAKADAVAQLAKEVTKQ